MAAKFYKVEVIMPSALVGPLMELVEGEGRVTSVVPFEQQQSEPVKEHRKKRPPLRIFGRGAGIPTGLEYAVELVKQAGASGITLAAIGAEFEKAGRAPNSASPATTAAIRKGLITRTKIWHLCL